MSEQACDVTILVSDALSGKRCCWGCDGSSRRHEQNPLTGMGQATSARIRKAELRPHGHLKSLKGFVLASARPVLEEVHTAFFRLFRFQTEKQHWRTQFYLRVPAGCGGLKDII